MSAGKGGDSGRMRTLQRTSADGDDASYKQLVSAELLDTRKQRQWNLQMNKSTWAITGDGRQRHMRQIALQPGEEFLHGNQH